MWIFSYGSLMWNPNFQYEERKIVSYKEVEQLNGDIEMVPVYEDDWSDDE